MITQPTTEELLEKALEHGAVLGYAIRHLASAWHRKHSTPDGPSWTHCSEHFCRMAHDAVEGRVRPANRTPSGSVTCLTPKERSA